MKTTKQSQTAPPRAAVMPAAAWPLTLDPELLLGVLIAFRKGDFTVRMPANLTGLSGKVADTLNEVIEHEVRLTTELTDVAHVVGKEGKMSRRVRLPNAVGAWAEKLDAINALITDLVQPATETARIIGAVAQGDLTQTMPLETEGRPLKGEFLRTAEVVNGMVAQLASFASEVTRVAREVGTDGKLGGQAKVRGVSGTWKDLTESVNSMAANLTAQVRNIAEVTVAVANGDLSKKITVDVRGEILQLKDTINTMVDQLRSFASEVTRVAREVGTDGKLGGQADVKGVSGTWKDLTDNVNLMASNLTNQVRNIATVTTAVANGDLSKKITVGVQGEILELKDTINTMVDQLNSFASEVTRVAREVGTEGKLGGQAKVKGVAGTWKDLTDNVNSMASNLTAQVRNIADVTTAVAKGDLTRKITVDVKGEILELKNTINTMVDQLSSFASEVTRVASEVGTEGKLGGQAKVRGVAGTWKDLTDSVNSMASNLTNQVRNIATVTTAVANGDLSSKITVDVQGEILELKNTINTMVDQLNSFASEVTRVAREVGTEGKLGGQAKVKGVAGTWKDLTDSVNSMASNLTAQVRNIADVTTAVAKGDLARKITVDVEGEILELKNTINTMVDQLNSFASEVTRVAREVGTEGKLGGQAEVKGVGGVWDSLTSNVNQLAANLTTQVRAIAEVATAVTKGDLTRSITAETRGEVTELKGNINEMIRNLRETTQKNSEQDWLKTNLAAFTRKLQGQRDLSTATNLILSELAPLVNAQHGVFYAMQEAEGDSKPYLKLLAGFAYRPRSDLPDRFNVGEGLVGQCALEKKKFLLTGVPTDYIHVSSGLGSAPPQSIIVVPVLFEGKVKAVIELASFERYTAAQQTFLDQLTESIGIVLNTIEANSRTEELLTQSQSLTEKLQSQQQELRQTNEQLEEKARQLAAQNVEVERTSQEVEQARLALEEKAAQLALTSQYKSEFLANMSHELRTPLNSMLLLSQQLADNPEGNLTPKQVKFAHTIHSSGDDLLELLTDILDLSKVESGTITLEISEVSFAAQRDFLERSFRPVAEAKSLEFEIGIDPELPPTFRSDERRIGQVLRNLLSNAFKFTERGKVTVRMTVARSGWSDQHTMLNQAKTVVAFAVSDTGIGIPKDKQQVIFEAFQQADAGTARKYGGTGLGLSISREFARMLGGTLRVHSVPRQGSTFTLYLPIDYVARAPDADVVEVPPARAPARTERPVLSPPSVPEADEAAALNDDRASIQPGDQTLLIVEDDLDFARIVLEAAHEQGFKAVVTARAEKALTLARAHVPSAILLDVRLPDGSGWGVFDRLKHDPATRHVPINILSVDEDEQRGLRLGALSYLKKPAARGDVLKVLERTKEFVQRPRKNLLVAVQDPGQRREVAELIGGEDVAVVAAATTEEAIEALAATPFDCVVFDPDWSEDVGSNLLQQLQPQSSQPCLPLVLYRRRQLSREEAGDLRKVKSGVVVREASSLEQLFDLTALFLHCDVSKISADRRELLEKSRLTDPALAGKKVLVVDDDIRNIFALTALLERHNMSVFPAENGREAIEFLQKTPGIDGVLMDIMMPGMDGYDTIAAVRQIDALKSLPILALTAKAMKGDRDKCLEAGATDYLAKPVNAEHLLSLLRVWLYQP
jgi:HAMP domain-containing protein/signal transduction histidine kinase/CheY-like chemotaxis protein